MGSHSEAPQSVPEELVVDVTAVAHGGHMIARYEGQVLFVRHALPGERVRVRVTDRTKSFLRADAIEVLEASADRVAPLCPVAAQCGGCDFQHVSQEGQLRLLGSVVTEQLSRIAHEHWDVVVEPIGDFTHWRTRMDWAVGPHGGLGLKQHRSHDVIENPDCVIAHRDLPALTGTWSGDKVRAVTTSTGQRFVATESPLPPGLSDSVDGVVDRRGNLISGADIAIESVEGREFEVSPTGFWQVHPQAAETLVEAVLSFAQPQAGEVAFDLYAGVGLFTKFLAERVGPTGSVHGVEGSRVAHEFARRNLAQFSHVTLHQGSVENVLKRAALPKSADLIVVDPPRAGAKPAIAEIAARDALRVVHVACDPASFARDVTLYRSHGYKLAKLRAFALFPMTHHVECVAMLEKSTEVRS